MLKKMKWMGAAIIGASFATYGCENGATAERNIQCARTDADKTATARVENTPPETAVMGRTETRDHWDSAEASPTRDAWVYTERSIGPDGTEMPAERVDPAVLPAHIRAVALREVPSGTIVAAGHYVTSDVGVFIVAVNGADGQHELKIRQDGVLLLNHRSPA